MGVHYFYITQNLLGSDDFFRSDNFENTFFKWFSNLILCKCDLLGWLNIWVFSNKVDKYAHNRINIWWDRNIELLKGFFWLFTSMFS